MPAAAASALAFAALLCVPLSIAAEFAPTVKLADGQAVTTSGSPLYGFARFMQPTLDLAGEWRRRLARELPKELAERLKGLICPPLSGQSDGSGFGQRTCRADG